MIKRAFCPNCQRHVYLECEAEEVCPVCSITLLASAAADVVLTKEQPQGVPAKETIHST